MGDVCVCVCVFSGSSSVPASTWDGVEPVCPYWVEVFSAPPVRERHLLEARKGNGCTPHLRTLNQWRAAKTRERERERES